MTSLKNKTPTKRCRIVRYMIVVTSKHNRRSPLKFVIYMIIICKSDP